MAISKDGNIFLVLSYDGEGINGDYDPEDIDDQPLMRFTAHVLAEAAERYDVATEPYFDLEINGKTYAYLPDACWCTMISANARTAVLDELEQSMADAIADSIRNGTLKSVIAELSRMSAS